MAWGQTKTRAFFVTRKEKKNLAAADNILCRCKTHKTTDGRSVQLKLGCLTLRYLCPFTVLWRDLIVIFSRIVVCSWNILAVFLERLTYVSSCLREEETKESHFWDHMTNASDSPWKFLCVTLTETRLLHKTYKQHIITFLLKILCFRPPATSISCRKIRLTSIWKSCLPCSAWNECNTFFSPKRMTVSNDTL